MSLSVSPARQVLRVWQVLQGGGSSHSASIEARQAAPVRAPQGLQVLRRSGRPDRPQGHPPAPQLRIGAWQDHAPPYLRQLRASSAPAHARGPAGSHRRPARPDVRVTGPRTRSWGSSCH